jgi:hypothetical protein
MPISLRPASTGLGSSAGATLFLQAKRNTPRWHNNLAILVKIILLCFVR